MVIIVGNEQIRVQILNGACLHILHRTNTLGNGIQLTILPLIYGIEIIYGVAN